MADFSNFRNLDPKTQVLVAVAVLRFGPEEAREFFTIPEILKVIDDLASIVPEVRLPYLGTMIRVHADSASDVIEMARGEISKEVLKAYIVAE